MLCISGKIVVISMSHILLHLIRSNAILFSYVLAVHSAQGTTGNPLIAVPYFPWTKSMGEGGKQSLPKPTSGKSELAYWDNLK